MSREKDTGKMLIVGLALALILVVIEGIKRLIEYFNQ